MTDPVPGWSGAVVAADTEIREGRPPCQLGFLPRPLPGESMLSWIDAAAATFGVSRSTVIDLLGVRSNPGHDLGRKLALLSPATLSYMAARSGLDEPTLVALAPGRAVGDEFALQTRYYGIPGYDLGASAACPQCVSDSGGRWRLAWKLGFFTICPDHGRYLASACACGQRMHQVKRTEDSRIGCPTTRQPGTRGPVVRCELPVADLVTRPAADSAVLGFQEKLYRMLSHPADLKEERRAWTELRFTIHLAAELGHPRVLSRADPCVVEAFTRFCRRRESTRDQLGVVSAALKSDPRDERLNMAAFLNIACQLLFSDAQFDAARRFVHRTEPCWNKTRNIVGRFNGEKGLVTHFLRLGMPYEQKKPRPVRSQSRSTKGPRRKA